MPQTKKIMRAALQSNALWRLNPKAGPRGARTPEPDATEARFHQIKIRHQATQPGQSLKDPTGTTDSWIANGRAVQIQGYTISSGLFYLGKNHSFSINPSFAVADPEHSTPWLQFDNEPSYNRLTPGQRAAYLDWLAHDRLEQSTVPLAYSQLLFAGLEHRLFMDCQTDFETVVAVADLLNRFPKTRSQLPLTDWIHFWGHFAGVQFHCVLIDWLLAEGHHVNTREELDLVLWSFARAARPLMAGLACDLAQIHPKRRAIRNWELEPTVTARFAEKFNKEFPGGLTLNPPAGTTAVRYRSYSRGLAGEVRLAGGPWFLTWDVPNVWTGNGGFSDVVQIWNEIVEEESAPKVTVDSGKLRALAEESRGVQQILAELLAAEDKDVPQNAILRHDRTTPAAQKPGQLHPRCQTILRQLIQRPSWTRQEFARLAKAQGLMPNGLIQDLNAWGMEVFQDRLLFGDDLIAVNQQLTSKIKI